MNSTTSLPFTSLSIHWSMLIFHPFAARRGAQARAFRLGYHFHFEEALADAALVGGNQRVGLGIDPPHARHEYEVAGPRAEAPGPCRFDRPVRREDLYPVRRSGLSRSHG